MKGCFFSLVFYVRTNAVSSAVCGCMHRSAWMCPLNKKVWHGQSTFWGCCGLGCIPHMDMQHCTHGFVSGTMKPFHLDAVCQHFPLIAEPKIPAGTDTAISRCKCKGDGGSVGTLFHQSPPLDFADRDKTLSLRPEYSPAFWVQANTLGLLVCAMHCSKAFHIRL